MRPSLVAVELALKISQHVRKLNRKTWSNSFCTNVKLSHLNFRQIPKQPPEQCKLNLSVSPNLAPDWRDKFPKAPLCPNFEIAPNSRVSLHRPLLSL